MSPMVPMMGGRVSEALLATPLFPGECPNHVDPVKDDGQYRRAHDLVQLSAEAFLSARRHQPVDESGDHNQDQDDANPEHERGRELVLG